ncbi:MAG: glycosyltransferase family 4 protein [Candidatus Nealsonbacteria bacterium]
MNLIYIANARIPTEKAHGFQIMKMCESFTSFGKVELVVPKRFNHIKEDPFDYYGINRIFKIKKLPCLDLIPLDRYFGHFGFWIENATFNFFVFFYILFKKADVFYTRDKFIIPFSLFKKNIVFEAHTFPKKHFLYSFFSKRLKKTIVITQKLKELFVEKGMLSEKILVAPDGVDLEKFNIEDNQKFYQKELSLDKDKKIVGYTGRLETMEQTKGIDILIRAFKILKEDFQEVLLCCVGGPERKVKEYMAFSKEIGIEEEDIIFIDQVKQKLIPKYLKSFDVLAIPFPKTQHYAFYASPLKLFEYMASKRPIVATDLPSTREVLNKENSILVGADSPESLAFGIKKALLNTQLSDKISKQAFLDVEKYTWKKRAENILNFIS